MNNSKNQFATSLQAKILSINTLNEYALFIHEHEKKNLNYLIGTNPLKIDGSFKAKIKHNKLNIETPKINQFGFDWFISVDYWFTCKYGYFSLQIKTCINGGGKDVNGVTRHCIYENQNIDLFKIDSEGNFCENDRPFDSESFKQYTESELLEVQKQAHEAAENYKAIAKNVPYLFNDVLRIERLTR
jgi:hypothetical protein